MRKLHDSVVGRKGISAYKEEAEHEFELLDDDTKQISDTKMRQHNSMRPYMESALIK